jgi:hypothetical protein
MAETCVQCPKCRELVATGLPPEKTPRFRDAVMRCPKCDTQFTWKSRDEVMADPQVVEAAI